MGIRDAFGRWPGIGRRRQTRQIETIRARLAERGIDVDSLADADLLALVADGRRALDAARVAGSDATGAFVVLVRNRERI